jgi:hypothetical protein
LASRDQALTVIIDGRPSHEAQHVARLALSKREAAEALGVSVDFLEEHVLMDVRVVRCGRRRLIPVCELERWLDAHASRTLGRSR